MDVYSNRRRCWALAAVVVVVATSTVAATIAPRRVIDLRSDTITRPTPQMRAVMADAAVGDDVFGEDPTVNELEFKIAGMFQKEAALWLPSGTQANLAATLSWCGKRDTSVLLGDTSHMLLFEQGGIAQIAGVAPTVLKNEPDGTIALAAVETALAVSAPGDAPKVHLVAVEDTHNYCGGRVLPAGYLRSLGQLAKDRGGIPVHLDGARVWNAATASGRKLSDMVVGADSVAVSLSKGLGAPAGSMLMGPADFVARARRFRKALGGGMRQVGVLAAAGLQAVHDYEGGLLLPDHARAKQLAAAIAQVPGFSVDIGAVETNIVIVAVAAELAGVGGANTAAVGAAGGAHTPTVGGSAQWAADMLRERGVLALPFGDTCLRLVTHRDLVPGDVEAVVSVFEEVAAAAGHRAPVPPPVAVAAAPVLLDAAQVAATHSPAQVAVAVAAPEAVAVAEPARAQAQALAQAMNGAQMMQAAETAPAGAVAPAPAALAVAATGAAPPAALAAQGVAREVEDEGGFEFVQPTKDRPSAATVTATTTTEAVATVEAAPALRESLDCDRSPSRSASALAKDESTLALIASVLLRRNDIFRTDLTPTQIRRVVDKAERQRVSCGDVIIQQGDAPEHFFIIESGRVEFFRDVDTGSKATHRKDMARIQLFSSKSAGDQFGEIALEYDTLRSATAIAATDTVLIRVHKDYFNEICDFSRFRKGLDALAAAPAAQPPAPASYAFGLSTMPPLDTSTSVVVSSPGGVVVMNPNVVQARALALRAAIDAFFGLDGLVDEPGQDDQQLTKDAAIDAIAVAFDSWEQEQEEKAAQALASQAQAQAAATTAQGGDAAVEAAEPVYYEEATVHGMSVSDDGFCVLLRGTVCDRFVRVLVTPSDPMSDGLDRDQVETSEAVTLLQLFQGIDVESHLSKDALQALFNEAETNRKDKDQARSGKQQYTLQRVLIDLTSTVPKRFRARLVGVLQGAGAAGAGMGADEGTLGGGAMAAGDSRSAAAGAVGGSDAPASPALTKEVEVEGAFEAIALALRHGAVVEVRSTLLQSEKCSYTADEVMSVFPKMVEGDSAIEDLHRFGTDYDARAEMERLQRRLFEAMRQGNNEKIESIKRQLEVHSHIEGKSVLVLLPNDRQSQSQVAQQAPPAPFPGPATLRQRGGADRNRQLVSSELGMSAELDFLNRQAMPQPNEDPTELDPQDLNVDVKRWGGEY